MKTATLLRKLNLQQPENKKAQVLRELNALLISTSGSRKTARSFIEGAIEYVEKH